MSDINVALPVLAYSGGKQQLIEVAKALNKNAKLLILDEPTSALTTTETETLLELLREFRSHGMACVYISHKIDEVAAIADTVTVIRDGTHIGTLPMRELDTTKIITMMVGREMKNLFPREEHEVGDVVFEAKNVTCWDPINPERKLVDDVSFELRAGEIVGVAGLVGAGRTELACKLFGYWRGDHEGKIFLEGKEITVKNPSDAVRQGICMVPEDRKRLGIIPLMPVGYNMTMSVLGRYVRHQLIDAEQELAVIQAEIIRMKIKTAHPLLPIASLSGGNQQKAVVGKMLLPEPKVLDPRRADPRRRRRRQIRDLQADLRTRQAGRRHPDDLFRNARGARHRRSRAGDGRRQAERQLPQCRSEPREGPRRRHRRRGRRRRRLIAVISNG